MSATPAAATVLGALAAIRRQARGVLFLRGLALSAAAILAAAAALALFEALVRPPLGARFLALAGAGAGAGGAILRLLVRPLRAALPDGALASLLEREYPFLGSSLATAVELSAGPPAWALPACVEAAVLEARERLSKVDPLTIVRPRAVRLAGAAAGAAAAVVLALALLLPDGSVAWRRALLLDEVPWPQRTSLRVSPAGSVLAARGDDVAVTATFGRSLPPRARFWTRRGSEPWTAEAAAVPASGEVRRSFRAVAQDFEFYVSGGDARSGVCRVRVRERPRVEDVAFAVRPPPHTGAAAFEVRRAADRIRAPEGSEVTVSGTASRPLGAASLGREDGDVPLEIEGARFTGAFVLAASGRVEIRIADRDGIAARPAPSILLEAIPDVPPAALLAVPVSEGILSPRAVVPASARAEDDYGVSEIGLLLERFPGGSGGPAPSERRSPPDPAGTAAPSKRAFEAQFTLADLGAVPGDRIRIRAFALDNDAVKGPKKGVSDPREFEVVEPARVEELLERRVLAFQEALERLLASLDEARQISARIAAAPPADRAASIRSVAERERGLGDRATPLAEALAQTLREVEIQRAGIPERRETLRKEALAPFRESLGKALPAALARWEAAKGAGDFPAAVAAARSAEDRLADAWKGILKALRRQASFQEVVRTLREMMDEQKRIREKTAVESENRLDHILGPKR